MKDLPSIEAEVGFNYDDDGKEFGQGPRTVIISSSIDEDNTSIINLSFDLGRKEDDDITLTFEAEEFMQKLIRAIAHGEDLRQINNSLRT